MHGPDFIVAGAMRAGTSALASALSKHPAVEMSQPKEPNYFATQVGALDFRGPGDQWFARQNSATWHDYLTCWSDEPVRTRGEASAMYLALPGTASLIRARLPKAKVVVVLRDPWMRALSAHRYLVTRGRETVSLETALELEPQRRRDGFGPMWWLRGASDYPVQLEAFRSELGQEDVLVVLSEDLRTSLEDTLRRIYAHLELEHSPAPMEFLASSEVNYAGVPRSRLATRILYPEDRVRRALRSLAPTPIRDLVRSARAASMREEEGEMPIPPSEFRAVARETATLLGRDLGEVWVSAR